MTRTIFRFERVFVVMAMLTLGLSVSSWSYAQVPSVLAPGDVVKITVYGNADLTTVARVSEQGTISFPLIGEVMLGGVSTFDAEKSIANSLGSGGFVKNAVVSIFIQERSGMMLSSATILGQVLRSGKYSLEQESAESVNSLIGLLAKAGGTTEKSAGHLFLIRQKDGKESKDRVDLVSLLQQGNMEENIILENGDVVLVPEMDVFYIYGEVQRPGRYRLERDMTILQAVAVASGLTPRGNEKGILLHRQENGKTQALKTNLTEHLKANDVVYVKSLIF